MKNLLFLLIVFLGLQTSVAQSDFRPGYIIKTSGDTLSGSINNLGDLYMATKCIFKPSNGDAKEYLPTEIAAYRLASEKYYVSKKVDNKTVFLEYLIEGKLDVFYFRDANGDHYYIEKEDKEFIELEYDEGLTRRDGKNYKYKTTKHTGILNHYLEDAPDMLPAIQKVKKPNHNGLIKLAEEYHERVCDDEVCVIYEKPLPITKVNIEVVGGGMRFLLEETYEDKWFPMGGVILNFWLPRVNERWFLRTGYLFANPMSLRDEKTNYSRIPLHFGYLGPSSRKLRPNFSIGLIRPTYSVGLMYKLHKHVNFGVQSWIHYDYNNFPLIPDRLNNYSLNGNLYFEF